MDKLGNEMSVVWWHFGYLSMFSIIVDKTILNRIGVNKVLIDRQVMYIVYSSENCFQLRQESLSPEAAPSNNAHGVKTCKVLNTSN